MAVYKPIKTRMATYGDGARSFGASASVKPISFVSPSSRTGSGSPGNALVPVSPTSKVPTATTPLARKSGTGVIGRTAATFGDIVANVLTGAAKSLEGVVDFGLTTVGAVGGIFSDEFRDAVQKHVQYDFVGEHIGDPLQEWTDESYLNELRIGKYSVGEAAELVAQGVGGMLPSIGLALLTGGGSVAAQIAGTGSMMVGAAGNATEEALGKGASYGSAAAYGLTRGVIEGATEFLGGVTLGGGTSFIGKKIAGTALGDAVQKGAGKVAYNFISEGAEEALSDLTDPLAKYLTGVDKNIGENYNDTIKGLPETFLVGGSVGTLMGGAQDFIRSKSKGQAERGGAAATRADYHLRNAIEMTENHGSGMDESKIEAAKLYSYQGVSMELQRMSAEHRAKYLESIGVHKLAFNEDGTLKAKAVESVNTEAVSPALRSLSGNLIHAPIGADVQISESAATAKETVVKALGKRANVAITDALDGDNAVYNPDEDVIYISNGALDGSSFNSEDVARAVALHEVAHKAEGTQAYLDMVDEVEKIYSDENAPADVKVLIGDRMQRRKELVKSYWDRDLSREQNRYVIDTELVSNMLGDLLGNSTFVERMGKRNSSAWERFVAALKAAHDGKAGGISKESQKYLSKLYKSYVKAVDAAGSGVKVSSIVDEDEKEKAADTEKGVDSGEKQEKKNSNERHSIQSSSHGNFVLVEESGIDEIMQEAGSSLPAKVRAYITKKYRGVVLPLGATDHAYIRREGSNEYTNPAKRIDEVVFEHKLLAASEFSNLLKACSFLKHENDDGRHPDATRGWNYYTINYVVPNQNGGYNAYEGVISIKLIDRGDCFYDMTKIRDITNGAAGQAFIKAAGSANNVSKNSIPQNSEKSTENAKKSFEVSNERSSKKAYRRADASATLEEAVREHLEFTDAYAKLKGQSKREATDILWKALNTAEGGQARKRAALDVADFVLDNAVVEVFGEDPMAQENARTVAILKDYMHKLDLDGIKGEIRNRFGKNNSIHLVWGKRKDSVGVAPDSIVSELADLGVIIDAKNPADIFFEIYDTYKKAKDGLEASASSLLKHTLSAEERSELREQISSDILRAYEEKGAETLNFNQFYKELEKAQRSAEMWKARYNEEINRNYIANRLLDKARQLDELKKGAFLNATQSKTGIEKFKGSIFRLARIRFRGNLNRTGTRKIFAALSEWYKSDDNALVKGTPGVYNESIANALEAIAKNEKPLSVAENAIIDGLMERFKTSDLQKLLKLYTKENLAKNYDEGVKHLLKELSSEVVFTSEELKTIEAVVDYFTHFVKNYNKVWRNGKYVNALDLAKQYIEKLHKGRHAEPGMLRRWFETYYKSFGDPMALARYMDHYDKHGFFTETLEELRHAALEAAVLEMEIREPLEKFYKEHKKFLGDLRTKNIKVWDGTEIPLAKGIALYMTLNREQAILGLARSGFDMQLSEKSAKVRVAGFAPMEEIKDEALAGAAKEARENLYNQFTEEEKQFIKIAEKIFGEDCKNAKHETDMIRLGFSNTIEGYYFPIARAYISHSIDSNVSFSDEMNRVSSAAFNKDTVTGAKGELFINDVDVILDRHVRGVTQYAKLSTVIDEFNVLYSLDIGENANKVTSILSEAQGTWNENEKYFRKLISDVQGIPASSRETIIDEWLPRIRSGYAKFQLGANPKTCLTQLSSLAAATSILDADCILKGFSVNAKDVDEYCALAKLRNTDNAAALAQGLIEKTSGLGDILMKPIGFVDRLVIMRLFAACQVQVAKNGGPALETKENKVKAGELLEKVIFETQQNSLSTEKSAAMRSENELAKAITMFSADGMKVFGRVVDGIGEYATLRALLKESKDPKECEVLQKKLKTAGKRARRSVGAFLSSAILMALLAKAVNKFLNRDDEEKAVEDLLGDVAGNLVGGLPLIRDVATFVFDGYEVNNYAYSAMNDMLQSAAGLYNLGAAALEGDWDSRKTAKTVRNALYAAGTVLGIPTRNVYNYTYGLINSISDEAGYKMDDLFYKQSYRADLAKAVEKGDEGMVATITALMLDENIGGLKDKTLRQTLSALIAAGFDVLPRSVGDSVTYDGQTYELSAKQRKSFEATYQKANEVAAKLVKSKGFASASDAVKAKAVGFVYDLYYDMALHELVGDGELGKGPLFASAIDVDVLALAIATAKSFEGDKDASGKTISGSLKKKIHDYVAALNLSAAQKHMIMGYLGYKNAQGEDKVRAYIQTLKLSDEQKKKLLEESGY